MNIKGEKQKLILNIDYIIWIIIFFIALLFILVVILLSTTNNEKYDFGGIEIEKKVVDDFAEVYGDKPFKICDIETGKCVIITFTNKSEDKNDMFK